VGQAPEVLGNVAEPDNLEVAQQGDGGIKCRRGSAQELDQHVPGRDGQVGVVGADLVLGSRTCRAVPGRPEAAELGFGSPPLDQLGDRTIPGLGRSQAGVGEGQELRTDCVVALAQQC
jgi:hypothetical protein